MKTPITYYGGKQQLAKTIINMMPAHRIYCEPFFGGGAVFFTKPSTFLEVINDKNDLLITFYKQCVDNFEELQHRVQHTLCSESEHEKARKIYNNPKHRRKIDIAWAVWVMTNMSIMATPRGGWKRDNGTGGSHVGVTVDNHRMNFSEEVHNRLKNVQISCHDALDVIKERDTEQTLFYLDPPYINCDQKHYKGYGEEDFVQLLEQLEKIKGKFILSSFMSDVLQEKIKKNRWKHIVIQRKCMIPALVKKPRKKYEVLTWNYNLERSLFEENIL